MNQKAKNPHLRHSGKKPVCDITKQVSTSSFTLLIVCIAAPLICQFSLCGNIQSLESHTRTRFPFTGLQIALAQPTKTLCNSKESWLRVFTLINLKDRDHTSGQKTSNFSKLCRCVTPILLFISNLIVNWQVHTDFRLDFSGTWMLSRNRPYPQWWYSVTESGIELFYSIEELSRPQTSTTLHTQTQRCLFSDLWDVTVQRSKEKGRHSTNPES